MSLDSVVDNFNDPQFRADFEQLPEQDQMGLQQEAMGQIIVDKRFQQLLQEDPDGAVELLNEFGQTLPIPIERSDVKDTPTVLRVMDATMEVLGEGTLDLLNALAIPGDLLRGVIAGKGGERLNPEQFVDELSEGGIEQVLKERGPAAATIRETAATLVDPLLFLPAAIRPLRRALTPRPGVTGPQPGEALEQAAERVELPEGPVPAAVPETVPPSAPKPPIAPDTPVPSGELPKFAGSVNLERVKTDDDVKRLILEASEQVPKREPIPLDNVRARADELGFTIEDAERFAAQTKTQRAKFLATRDVNVALQEQYQTSRAAYVAEQTPANFEQLRQAQIAALRGFKAAQGVGSEAGLALRTFAIGAEANVAKQAERSINQLLTRLQTKGRLSDEIVERMATLDMNNPEQVNSFLRVLSTETASFTDKLFEGWMASILSGPQTHMANIMGNTGTLMLRPFERLGAATIEAGRAAIKGVPRERFIGEAASDAVGMAGALPDATRTFLRTMRTSIPSESITKLDIRGPSIGGRAGTLIRTPLTLLSATDDFFKVFAKRGERYAQAYRISAQEGHKGLALRERVAALVKNPTESMLETEASEALYRTFQTPVGPLGRVAFQAREQVPFLRWVVPFVRTPINIAKFGLERTGPLNAVKIMRMAQRGELPEAGALSDELSKLAIGSFTAAAVANETLEGSITGGGPVDPEQRRALLATGWQPYSIKVGDIYYSYSRLEPFATMIGVVADTVELMELADEEEKAAIITKTAEAITKNLTSKTFLEGLNQAFDALHDPGRYGERFIGQLAGGVVPSIVASAARAQDPNLREARDILSRIRSRVPGETIGREGLPPKRDIRGEAIPAPGNFWTRLLSPAQVSQERGTLVDKIVAEQAIEIGRISETFNVAGKRLRLTPEQFDRLQVVSGAEVAKELDQLERIPNFYRAPRIMQETLVKRAVQKGRRIGKALFMDEFAASKELGTAFQESLERERRKAK